MKKILSTTICTLILIHAALWNVLSDIPYFRERIFTSCIAFTLAIILVFVVSQLYNYYAAEIDPDEPSIYDNMD